MGEEEIQRVHVAQLSDQAGLPAQMRWRREAHGRPLLKELRRRQSALAEQLTTRLEAGLGLMGKAEELSDGAQRLRMSPIPTLKALQTFETDTELAAFVVSHRHLATHNFSDLALYRNALSPEAMHDAYTIFGSVRLVLDLPPYESIQEALGENVAAAQAVEAVIRIAVASWTVEERLLRERMDEEAKVSGFSSIRVRDIWETKYSPALVPGPMASLVLSNPEHVEDITEYLLTRGVPLRSINLVEMSAELGLEHP